MIEAFGRTAVGRRRKINEVFLAIEIEKSFTKDQIINCTVFAFDGSRWSLEHKLVASDAGWYRRFGESVSLRGARALTSLASEGTPR